jgi:tetratricopeptide (TPR) repeat protein
LANCRPIETDELQVTSRKTRLLQHAEQALALGNTQQAIAACRELNIKFPRFADGWRIAVQIHLRLQKHGAALVAAERILALCPDDVIAKLQRVESLIGLERDEEAISLLQTVAEADHCDARIRDQIGRLLASLQLHEEALEQYRAAADLEPDNARIQYNLATAQRFLGQLEEAEASLDRGLEIDPYDFEAQAMRSSLRKQTPSNNHVEMLQRLLRDPAFPAEGTANIFYALAKEFDDLDQPDESFGYLNKGASARRQGMSYDVETDVEIMSAIVRTFDEAFFSVARAGADSDEPIFIIGMPRTGTTLVERILGSHSSVFAAGELDNFGREVMRQIGETATPSELTRTQIVEKSATLDFARLGRDYISSTRPATGQTHYFIDKLPFNYLYVGLVRVALPNAKIVNLTRHPMATCYAVYKQFFRDAYPFSYDLGDLGRYYIAYRQLMQHWREVLPGAVCFVAYEDVVRNTESEARRLLDFCGLDWEPRVLEFQSNRQASTTASASQVRQPVYDTSIDRWRAYHEYLVALETMLRDAGIETT